MKRSLILLGAFLLLWLLPAQVSASTLEEQMQWLHEHFDVNFIYDSSLDLSLPYKGPSMQESAGELRDEAQLKKCLAVLFQGSGISWEINRKYVVLTKGRKKPKDYTVFIEHQTDTLEESRITALLSGRGRGVGTGFERIDGVKFRRGFAVLSSPDVIKTLQVLPGVSSGTEMLGGLYVHGGTGSDNLFHLDGVPMFNISHLAGLYSSFNTDIIESLDFYKSGFPARYGGRLSSVVDISVRDGSMSDYKCSFTVGLVNGAFQLEGPIVRNRTSFNVALRRSWLEALSIPGLALFNKYREEGSTSRIDAGYALTDLNAKLTHILSDKSILRLNLYAGRDKLTFRSDEWDDEINWYYPDKEDYFLRWGNLLSSLSWNGLIADRTPSELKLYYTQYRSRMAWNRMVVDEYDSSENFLSAIHDIGLKGNFERELSALHRLRYGFDNQLYIYAPEQSWNYKYPAEDACELVISGEDEQRYVANETSVYVEDSMNLTDWLSADAGLRAVLFAVKGKAYARLEPRLVVCARASEHSAFKLSYTEMNQLSHRLVTAYIDLPSSVWLPSIAGIAPMNSRQLALGAEFSPIRQLRLDMELFYKRMNHIREYKGYTLFPPLSDWQEMFVEGKGRAYGMEAGLTYMDGRTDASVYYTLSWSERYFEELFPGWFSDHFDNRHRLNISVNHRFSKKFEMYAGWNWHTGNRVTLESQVLPDENGYDRIYTSPNNMLLPDYHRLDVGFNFHKTTRRGNESIWNLSIYNLYCRMNALTVDPPDPYEKNSKYEITGLLPVIPTFSYTLRF